MEAQQKLALKNLLAELTHEEIEDWYAVVAKARNADGSRFDYDDEETKQWKKENQVGMKIYCHRNMRAFMNNYTDYIGMTVSELVRELLIKHFKEEKARYLD
jgi:ATP phosphoribosyltransferase regulatory subunit HisZ